MWYARALKIIQIEYGIYVLMVNIFQLNGMFGCNIKYPSKKTAPALHTRMYVHINYSYIVTLYIFPWESMLQLTNTPCLVIYGRISTSGR